MTDWENCDYLLWPAWYSYTAWAIIMGSFLTCGYLSWSLGL